MWVYPCASRKHDCGGKGRNRRGKKKGCRIKGDLFLFKTGVFVNSEEREEERPRLQGSQRRRCGTGSVGWEKRGTLK